MSQTTKDLQNIEKAVVRLRNKLNRVDINYNIQISISSTDPEHVTYAAQLTSPAEGLAPMTFIADSAEEIITQIKVTTKSINQEKVEIAYHKAQIKSCERTILGHEERIKAIENPDPEVEEIKTDKTKEEENTTK